MHLTWFNISTTSILQLFSYLIVVQYITAADSNNSELLTPYIMKHGSRLGYRAIRECQEQHNTTAHEIYPSHDSLNVGLPFVDVKRFVQMINFAHGSKIVRGHIATVSNPKKTLSVLEPSHSGGCSMNLRETVTKSSRQKKCVVAINAGYFDTHTGECKGNVISDGRKAYDSGGIQNAHFGIRTDGSIFTGYISSDELQKESLNFLQLVGGVVWLVRNGTNFVNTSKFLECESTEETGPMENFINVLSARTAVGHDKNGKVVVVHVDGKTNVDGVSLLEFQALLTNFDIVNAINLDGGGSSTFVINDTVVNYPYDECLGNNFQCERNVSTILCIHPPDCDPYDCSGHGRCEDGECVCHVHWRPPACDQFLCSEHKCCERGTCTVNGCICEPGFIGDYCEKSCEDGWFGFQCMLRCNCSNNYTCDAKTGFCKCLPGFYGTNCDMVIADLVARVIEGYHLVKDSIDDKSHFQVTIILSIVTAISISSTLLLLFYTCSCFCKSKPNCGKKIKYKNLSALVTDIAMSDSSDNENVSVRLESQR